MVRYQHHGLRQGLANARTETGWSHHPVEITVFEDRSFTFITKTLPLLSFWKRPLVSIKASGEPNKNKVATINRDKVKEIAETKMKDLNAADVEAASAWSKALPAAWVLS